MNKGFYLIYSIIIIEGTLLTHDEEPIKDTDMDVQDSIIFSEELTNDTEAASIPKIDEACFSFYPRVSEPLSMHIDKNIGVILGRSQNFHAKYLNHGLELIGAVSEKSESKYGSLFTVPVYLDFIKPHVIFVAGKRGSGKSYTLGVIAESLGFSIKKKDIRVSVIIIDTVDVFRQMVYPNVDQSELLKKWGLEPSTFDNLIVFIPYKNYNKLPPNIVRENHLYPLKISPAELSTGDWTYILEKEGRFSTSQENLLGEAIDLLKKGYTANISGETIKRPPKRKFSIDDLIECIDSSVELNRFYSFSTRTAIIQRLRTAKKIGIFHKDGTSINEIARENTITIIDVSSLGANAMRALSILTSILSRQILAHRMEWDDTGITKRDELPPTWLIVDEAQTLVPRTGRTPATDALISYAKLGRRFGCSLVLCTQQPASVNDQVISQADILISHNLSYDADIRALRERAPAYLPEELKSKAFISSLPSGVAIVFDQVTENTRGFIMQVRPRVSRHGGEDKLSDILKTIDLLPERLDEESSEEELSEDKSEMYETPLRTPETPELSFDESSGATSSFEEKDKVSSKRLEHFEVLDKVIIKLFSYLPIELLTDVLERKLLYSRKLHDHLNNNLFSYYKVYSILPKNDPIDEISLILQKINSFGISDFKYVEVETYPFIICNGGNLSIAITVGASSGTHVISILIVGEKSEVSKILKILK